MKLSPRALSSAVVAAVVGLLACDGSFRFDPEPRDAGAELPASASGIWPPEACDGGFCPLTCPSAMLCIGTCGASCSAKCEEDSHCALTAGETASVECESGASCDLALGPAGHVECEEGSVCHVHCSGACSIACQPTSTCDLQCGLGPANPVTGSASCP